MKDTKNIITNLPFTFWGSEKVEQLTRQHIKDVLEPEYCKWAHIYLKVRDILDEVDEMQLKVNGHIYIEKLLNQIQDDVLIRMHDLHDRADECGLFLEEPNDQIDDMDGYVS